MNSKPLFFNQEAMRIPSLIVAFLITFIAGCEGPIPTYIETNHKKGISSPEDVALHIFGDQMYFVSQQMYAVDLQDGALLWKRPSPKERLLVDSERVYGVFEHGDPVNVYYGAADRMTGENLWIQNQFLPDNLDILIGLKGDSLIIQKQDTLFYFQKTTGQPLKRTALSCAMDYWINAQSILMDSLYLVYSMPLLYGVDLNKGLVKWQAHIGVDFEIRGDTLAYMDIYHRNDIFRYSIFFFSLSAGKLVKAYDGSNPDVLSSFTISQGKYFVALEDNAFGCFDQNTGQPLWNQNFAEWESEFAALDRFGSSALYSTDRKMVVANDALFVFHRSDKAVFRMNATTGELEKVYLLPDHPQSDIYLHQGYLYLLTEEGISRIPLE